jgi:hypothetical protein
MTILYPESNGLLFIRFIEGYCLFEMNFYLFSIPISLGYTSHPSEPYT